MLCELNLQFTHQLLNATSNLGARLGLDNRKVPAAYRDLKMNEEENAFYFIIDRGEYIDTYVGDRG